MEKSIMAINAVFLQLGIDIKLIENSEINYEAVFLCLPVGNQIVYFLGPKYSEVKTNLLSKYKYRYDLLFKDTVQGFKVEEQRIIVRNEKYLVIIQPKGLDFETQMALINQ